MSNVYGQGEKREKTKLTPILNAKIDGQTNLVYCVTFQLAWDELKKLAKGNIETEEPSKLVESLNNSPVKSNVLPKDSYIALSGFIKDGIIEKISKELKKEFGKNFEDLGFNPDFDGSFIAFSYLYRKLPFENKFHRFKKKYLVFQHGQSKTNVVCFGCTPKTAEKYEQEIRIRNYVNKDDFIIQLLTEKENETVVLAKIPDVENLQDAVDITAKYILKKWKSYEIIEKDGEETVHIYTFSSQDAFIMPVIKLDKNTNYDELCGKSMKNSILSQGLAQAFQKVKFNLDESGATLTSYGMSCDGCNPEPRKFIFNKPFLVCLWKTGAKLPYLAVWVNNPDILLEYKKK
jgi:hypothetical protein